MLEPATSKVLPRGAVAHAEELLNLIWELPRLWRQGLDRRLKPLGLSEAKWRAVLFLSHGGPTMSQVELASLMGIEAPSLARLLDRLAVDGWIERRASAHDRRIKTIHLQPKASSVIKRIDAVIVAMRAEIVRGVSRNEMRACVETLRKIRANTDASAGATKLRSRTRIHKV